MADEIKVGISGYDELSPILQKINANLKELNKNISALSKSFNKLFSDKVAKTTQKVNKSIKENAKNYAYLRKEAKATIKDIQAIYKKAESLGGFKFLSKEEIGRLGGLVSKLNRIMAKLPKGERTQVAVEKYLGVDLAKAKITQRLEKDITDQYKKELKQRSKLLEWYEEYKVKKQKEAALRQKRDLKAESTWQNWIFQENLKKQKEAAAKFIRDLKANSKVLEWIEKDKVRQQKEATARFVSELKANSKVLEWIGKEKARKLKYSVQLVKNSLKEEEKYIKAHLSALEKQLNVLMQSGVSSGRLGLIDQLKAKKIKDEIVRYTNLAKQKGFIIPADAERRIMAVNYKIKELNKNAGAFKSTLVEWWKRFGAVALGFTIMYRAMLYFEMALGSVIGLIRDGIQAFDDFQEATVRLSMFYQIFTGFEDRAKAIDYATSSIEGLKLATVDALSPIQDITQGIDELAQHGVFLNATLMKDFVNLTDFIGMIAKTTGSQANQIRQELQALFEGTQRAGNTLIRFLAKLFGDKFVKEIQKTTTPLEQFMKIMQKISKYVEENKADLFARSFTLNLQRAKNIFTLIVQDALKLSNILRGYETDINPFSRALSNITKSLGFDAYIGLQNLRMQIADITAEINKNKELGIIDTEKINRLNDLQAEYNKRLQEFARTPAADMIISLTKLFDTLAYSIMPAVVKAVISVSSAIINFVVIAKNIYSENKVIINSFLKWTAALIGLKVAIKGITFVLREPVVLLYSLSKGFLNAASFALAFTRPLTTLITKIWGMEKAISFVQARMKLFSVAMAGILAGVWAIWYATFDPENAKKLGKSFINAFMYEINLGFDKLISVLTKLPDAIISPKLKLQLNSFRTLVKDNIKTLEDISGGSPLDKFKENFILAIKTTTTELGKGFKAIEDVVFGSLENITKSAVDELMKNTEDKVNILNELFGVFNIIEPIQGQQRKTEEIIQKQINAFDKLLSYKQKLLDFKKSFGLISIPDYYDKMLSLFEQAKVKYQEQLKDLQSIGAEETKILDVKMKILDVEERIKTLQDERLKYSSINVSKKELDILTSSLERVLSYTEKFSALVPISFFKDTTTAHLKEIEKRIDILRNKIAQVQSVEEKNKLREELQQYVSKYEELRRNVRQTTITLAGSVKDVFRAVFTETITQFGTTFTIVKNGMSDLVSGIADVLQNQFYNILTGKFTSLKDMMYSLGEISARVLSQIITQLLVIKSIQFAMGSTGTSPALTPVPVIANANGNVLNGTLEFFANGGIVSNPTLAVIGEGKYKEAVVPLPDGRSIPAKVVDNQPQQTEVNIVNVVDPAIMGDYLLSSQGQNAIINIVANNKYKIKKILTS